MRFSPKLNCPQAIASSTVSTGCVLLTASSVTESRARPVRAQAAAIVSRTACNRLASVGAIVAFIDASPPAPLPATGRGEPDQPDRARPHLPLSGFLGEGDRG